MATDNVGLDKLVDAKLEEAGKIEITAEDAGLQTVVTPEGVKIVEPLDDGSTITQATPAETKPAQEPQTETVVQEPPKSFVLDEETHQPQYVPLPEHLKLRQRAQAAEAKVAELMQKQSQVVPDIIPQIQLPEIPDDEMLTGKQVKQREEALLKASMQASKQMIEQTVQGLQKKSEETNSQNVLSANILRQEAEARKSIPDFDAVLQSAIKNGLIAKTDKIASLDYPNPAKMLYLTAKNRLAGLGIQPTIAKPVVAKQEINQPEVPEQSEKMEVVDNETLFRGVFERRKKSG